MRVGLVQLNSQDNPLENIDKTASLIREAANQSADLVITPEVTNCVSTSRAQQSAVLEPEQNDPTLAHLRALATELKIWLIIGSLAIKTQDADGRFANRQFVLDPNGQIRARYDKIHMFDVTVSDSESYHESHGYRPGDRAVLVNTDMANIGLTICYDVRFPHLYRDLAQAGAQIITVPSAFSSTTGAIHWETLLRARAIETGCYILAPAQCGAHPGRQTYGHTMAVAPWGEVLVNGRTQSGVFMVNLDLNQVNQARAKIPAWQTQMQYKVTHV
jgi:predicted amidohydrolase